MNKFDNDGSFLEQFMKDKKPTEDTAERPAAPIKVTWKTKGQIGGIKKKSIATLMKEQSSSSKNVFGDHGAQTLTKEETNTSVKERPVQSEPTKSEGKQNVASPTLLNKSKSEDVKKTLGSSEAVRMKRKRKSRWGKELTEDERAVAVASATFSTATATPYNKPQLTAEQQQQLREQQAMTAIVTQMCSSGQQQNKHNKYEYDSDEDTEGGTWEHKLRSTEMEATKVLAEKVTEESKGKHHIGDFLPPEELEKFVERVKAARGETAAADLSDYAKHKIDESNIGYQMLKNSGWTEGQGLGSNEDGITAPVDKGKVSFDQAGVGMASTGDVSNSDDDFDAYRKRMMLAYKFRPNPLNNPRRPYY